MFFMHSVWPCGAADLPAFSISSSGFTMRYLLTKWFLSLPDSLLLRLSGRPQMTASGGRLFDPAGQFVVVNALKQGVFALDDSKSAAELREIWNKQMEPFSKPPLKTITRKDHEVAVEGGTIPIAQFAPRDVEPGGPAVVYFHGGGFSSLGIHACRSLCEYFAQELEATVFAVGYRLAPEHQYPTQLNDADAAFDWVMSNAKELQIDPARVSVGGDSAGGNLSATVCIKRRDLGASMPRAQLLVYPILDWTFSHPSIEELGEGHIITKRHMEWFRANLLPDLELVREPYVSPHYAEDLSGLPPAVVATAGFDLLRDEAEVYAKRLSAAGVATTYREFPSEGHGFMYADTTASVRAANAAISEMFKKLL